MIVIGGEVWEGSKSGDGSPQSKGGVSVGHFSYDSHSSHCLSGQGGRYLGLRVEPEESGPVGGRLMGDG